MKPRHIHYDVVIVGAGLAGCATAQALALADSERRRRILIIDRHPGVHPRFSGEWIHPRGAQILDELGFYPALQAAGAMDVDGFAVFEDADSPWVDLAYSTVTGERPHGMAVHHKVLVRTLRRTIAELGRVELCEGWTVVELRRDSAGKFNGILLESNDGNTVELACDLIVAADGKGSTVRKLAGITGERETLGFTAGVEVLDATLPAPGYAHVMLGAWGPILVYPILRRADGRTSVRVTFDMPRELPAKGEGIKQYLLRAFVPFLPAPLAEQVASAIVRHKGPLEMAPTVNLPAPEAMLPGLVLVGDAGGCSHPITASGMTMGLRDAQTLGLEGARRMDAPTGEPWLDAASLRRYKAEHDRYVPTRQALADAIYEAFRGGTTGSRAIRRALFDYWNSGPTARRRSMALLSCAEGRPSVFISEYLRASRFAIGASLIPKYAASYPVGDRLRQARGALQLAQDKLGIVATVMWAQVRPSWDVARSAATREAWRERWNRISSRLSGPAPQRSAAAPPTPPLPS